MLLLFTTRDQANTCLIPILLAYDRPYLVGVVGLEPTRITPTDFKSVAATNYAILPFNLIKFLSLTPYGLVHIAAVEESM